MNMRRNPIVRADRPAPLAAKQPLPSSLAQALERAARSHALDGRVGANRCRTRVNQLGVESDVEAVFAWINDRAGSPKTARDFLSQARRLIWWALERCPNPNSPRGVGKALSDLTRQDLMAYREYLKRPDRAACGVKRPFLDADGNVNSEWRPFEGPLTSAHIEHVFLVLKNLFRYLADMGYLDGNPLAGARARAKGSMGDHSKRNETGAERRLDAIQWIAVLEAIDDLPHSSDAERYAYERALFMMMVFFHLGARIGEIASHRMKHFVKNRKGEWSWSVVGKGGKHALVPVNGALLAALARYRVFLGLSPLPHPRDETPLLMDWRRRHALSERQIARLVKEIFQRAAERLRARDPQKAAELAIASPHWIRHAMGSILADRAKDLADLRALQQLMRHSKLETTLETYTHVADEAKRKIVDLLGGLPQHDARIS